MQLLSKALFRPIADIMGFFYQRVVIQGLNWLDFATKVICKYGRLVGMKKLILFIAILSTLNGCARTYIQSWKDNEVVACGNNHANEETIDELAKTECRGPATKIGGHLQNAGMAHVGYGVYQQVNNRCFTYKCERGHSPASISAQD
jgi:hypothetical protein